MAAVSENNLNHQSQERESVPGKVFLVGAGPGHPGAITLRAIECLQQADVVLYDYLVNPAHLKWAATHAELISLGRHGNSETSPETSLNTDADAPLSTDLAAPLPQHVSQRIMPQSEVNQRMVQWARAGKRVVRLKSGDPIVFARLGEETDALRHAGLEFEIVPGVTSALAVGSFAGIALTHRDHSSAVALVTGHPAQDAPPLDWQAMAKFPGTLVIYMGTTQVEHWANELMQGGLSSQTPVAIVRRCSFADQSTQFTTLGQVVTVVTVPKRLRPPVLFVIGQVAQQNAGLNWFERLPLFGQKVLVTRPQGQSETLGRHLQELGATPFFWPAIEILPPLDFQPLDAAIDRLAELDWMVFSSVNGVQFFFDRLWQRGLDVRAVGACRIAAIGEKTQQRLSDYRMRSDLVPQTFDADHLADALVGDAAGKRFLLVRASRGRDELARRLTLSGGQVQQVVAYRNHDTELPNPNAPNPNAPNPNLSGSEQDADRLRWLQLLKQGQIDWVTVTSSAIAVNLVKQLGDDLRRTRLVSISPITSATLRGLGYEVHAEASHYTAEGIVSAVLDFCHQRGR